VSSAAAGRSPETRVSEPGAVRSPLAQLLHALNQPLTGLQCSMEVALAAPRTPEQYVRGLREGLELTERMRALVEAIREVADAGQEKQQEQQNGRKETMDLNAVLREAVEDLAPVAEVKNVRMKLECLEPSAPALIMGRQRVLSALFRFLESALSLTARDNVLLLETGTAPAEYWIRVRWQMGRPHAAFSRPELGLMVAQASFEAAGATWERERSETFEAVTLRLPGLPDGREPS
jgi:signal transduction histidine kinase